LRFFSDFSAPEDDSTTLFRNFGGLFPSDAESHPRRTDASTDIYLLLQNYSHFAYISIVFAAFREMEAARLKFLGGFGKLRKATVRVVISVRPPARVELSSCLWRDFHEICYFSRVVKELCSFEEASHGNASAQPHAYRERLLVL
jgi:hypothetical protein